MKAVLTLVVTVALAQFVQADCKSELKGHAEKYKQTLAKASPECVDYVMPPGKKDPLTAGLKCGLANANDLKATTEAKRTTCKNACQGVALPENACKEDIGLKNFLEAIAAI